MKGIIALSIKEMLIKHTDMEGWTKVLTKSGLPVNYVIKADLNIEDEVMLSLFKYSAEEMKLKENDFFYEFGNYWINVYALRHYPFFFDGVSNMKDFLLNIKNIHQHITKTIKDSIPPDFEFEFVNEGEIILKYISKRNLKMLVKGLLVGCSNYFNQKIELEELSSSRFRILFLS